MHPINTNVGVLRKFLLEQIKIVKILLITPNELRIIKTIKLISEKLAM